MHLFICKGRLDGVMERCKQNQSDFYNADQAARDMVDTALAKKTPLPTP